MKIWKSHNAFALGITTLGATTLAGGMLTHLTAQAPTTQATIAPPLFKSYQAGLREAQWTNKPLFVIFRCER